MVTPPDLDRIRIKVCQTAAHKLPWCYSMPGGVLRDGVRFDRRVRCCQLHRTHPTDDDGGSGSGVSVDEEAEWHVQWSAAEDDDDARRTICRRHRQL